MAADRDAVQRRDRDRSLLACSGMPAELAASPPWAHSSPETVGSRPEASRKSSVASTRRSIRPAAMSCSSAGVEAQL